MHTTESTASANCQLGEHQTGGGHNTTAVGGATYAVVDSFPNGTGWVVRVRNTEVWTCTDTVTTTAYVLCASP
jgi:hypothetical protein